MKNGEKFPTKLCKGCIEELQNYNPYIYDDGSQIPLENLVITTVKIPECVNSNL